MKEKLIELADKWRAEADKIIDPIRNESMYFSELPEHKQKDYNRRFDYSSGMLKCAEELRKFVEQHEC